MKIVLRVAVVAVAGLCAAPLAAQDAGGGPADVVDAFHTAMTQNYQQGVLEQLAPEVLIYEQGYEERSRDEYSGGHLHNDMAFAAATQRSVIRREAGEDGDSAWVLTQSLTEGRFGEREISLVNTETMLLRREGQGWKITHIHWSAHPRPPRPAAAAPPPAAATPTPPAQPAVEPAAPAATPAPAPATEPQG